MKIILAIILVNIWVQMSSGAVYQLQCTMTAASTRPKSPWISVSMDDNRVVVEKQIVKKNVGISCEIRDTNGTRLVYKSKTDMCERKPNDVNAAAVSKFVWEILKIQQDDCPIETQDHDISGAATLPFDESFFVPKGNITVRINLRSIDRPSVWVTLRYKCTR